MRFSVDSSPRGMGARGERAFCGRDLQTTWRGGRKTLGERAALAACDAISEYGRSAHTARQTLELVVHHGEQLQRAAGKYLRRRTKHGRPGIAFPLYTKIVDKSHNRFKVSQRGRYHPTVPRSPNLSPFGSKLTSRVSQERGYHWGHSQQASDIPWTHAAS